jgi:hypothetical protein
MLEEDNEDDDEAKVQFMIIQLFCSLPVVLTNYSI